MLIVFVVVGKSAIVLFEKPWCSAVVQCPVVVIVAFMAEYNVLSLFFYGCRG